jgi:hypothetical protein
MEKQLKRNIIASRVLEVDGTPNFNIHVAQPYLEADGVTWRCEYEISGPMTKHINSFGGVDAVQALLNALYALSVEAEMSEENQRGKLSWGGQSGHFGFPAPEADPERTR